MLVGTAVVALLPPAVQAGDRYALLVGIGRYEGSLADLPFAEGDVTALAGLLLRAGYDPANVVVLSDSAGDANRRFRPTTKHIVHELSMLVDEIERGDSLLVAYAGHGEQAAGRKRKQRGFSLCTLGGKRGRGKSRLPLSTLYEMLDQCRAEEKLLLLDACRPPAEPEETISPSPSDPVSAVSEAPLTLPSPQQQASPAGLSTVFSCSAGQYGYDHEDAGRSIFFHYVLEALEGAADADADDVVTLGELDTYLARHVRRTARIHAGQFQEPDRRGEMADSLALLRLPLGVTPETLEPTPLQPRPVEVTDLTVDLAPRRDVPTLDTIVQPAEVVTQGKPIENAVGMQLRLIPAGEFTMGSPDDEPLRQADETLRQVRVSRPLYLGVHEVTAEQFARVMGSNPSYFSPTGEGRRAAELLDVYNLPVHNVTWEEAVEFCRRLSAHPDEQEAGRRYRLPTEAEWEYAARAGSRAPFASGDQLSDEVAVFTGSELNHPLAVGTRKPNAFGLYDMHGNVWEWCADWYAAEYAGSSDDPAGPAEGRFRVLRGGAWDSPSELCRSAVREAAEPGSRIVAYGFRVVCEVMSQPD